MVFYLLWRDEFSDNGAVHFDKLKATTHQQAIEEAINLIPDWKKLLAQTSSSEELEEQYNYTIGTSKLRDINNIIDYNNHFSFEPSFQLVEVSFMENLHPIMISKLEEMQGFKEYLLSKFKKKL